jgi:hypothetical protein
MVTQQLSVDPEKLSRVSELQSRLRDKQAANETLRRQIANSRQALRVSEEEEAELKNELDSEMSDLPNELASFIISAVTSNGKKKKGRKRGGGGGIPTEDKLDWAETFIGDANVVLTDLYTAYRDTYGGDQVSDAFRKGILEGRRFIVKGKGRDRTVSVRKERKKTGK